MSVATGRMPRVWLGVAVLAFVAAGGEAVAQSTAGQADHSAHHPAAAGAPVNDDFTEAQVRRIDRANAKVTLRHGEIKSLGMPPMTMVFHVDEPAVLDALAPGDKVMFRAVHEAGQYRVTQLRRLGP